jgi:putative 4-mercaptohistidine N1-methyltranferase
VTECVDGGRLPVDARALDLGCAVGRSSFELARSCVEVIGIDASTRFIEVAGRLQRDGAIDYARPEEGDLTLPTHATVAPDILRDRVRFETGDAMRLRADLGAFDVVLMANLIDRLSDPRACLERLPALVKPGGRLVITSPYTWLTEYTPRENWLGGFERDGHPVRTFDTLKQVLSPEFRFVRAKDMPFLIREHARKFQWSVAEASIWLRRTPG